MGWEIGNLCYVISGLVFIALLGFGWIVSYRHFMHPVLTVIGIVIIGVALRSCRARLLRKLGMLVYLISSGVALYFMTGSVLAGLAGMGVWFLLPWFCKIFNFSFDTHEI